MAGDRAAEAEHGETATLERGKADEEQRAE